VGAGSGRRVGRRSAQGGQFVRGCPGGFGVLCFLWLRDRGSRSWNVEHGGGRVEEKCRRWRRGLGLRVGLAEFEVCNVVVRVSWKCLMLCW
jgi:hypothetical protein